MFRIFFPVYVGWAEILGKHVVIFTFIKPRSNRSIIHMVFILTAAVLKYIYMNFLSTLSLYRSGAPYWWCLALQRTLTSPVCCHINISTVWFWSITVWFFQQVWLNLSSTCDAYVALLRLDSLIHTAGGTLIISIQSQNKKNETCSISLCSSLALGIQLASKILIDLLAWLGFSISFCGASEGEHTPQHQQIDCGSAGEVDSLCLSEMTCSFAATHTLLLLLSAAAWPLRLLISSSSSSSSSSWRGSC